MAGIKCLRRVAGGFSDIVTPVRMDHPTKIAPLSIPDFYRTRHMFVFGTTGVGKTRLCENLIEQDINKGGLDRLLRPQGGPADIHEDLRCGAKSRPSRRTDARYPHLSGVLVRR